MNDKYQIWDRKSDVTTVMDSYTPEEWINRHPWLKDPEKDAVISVGAINGGFICDYDYMVKTYLEYGCPIPASMIQDDKQAVLDIMSEFDDIIFDCKAIGSLVNARPRRFNDYGGDQYTAIA